MKRTVFLLVVILFSVQAISQAPHAFKYQAVIRDNNGNIISNQNIGVKVCIVDDSLCCGSIYTETHAVTSNNYGVINLNVGNGTPIAGNFSTIDWSNGNHYVRLEVDMTGGTNYVVLGTTQILSVPYANYAEKAGYSPFPAGMIMAFAGDVAHIPEGWLLCDGSISNSSQFPELYNIIGTTWGNGNGSAGSFNVPDLRGSFLRGVDGSKGNDPDKYTRTAIYPGGNTGNEVGSVQGDGFSSHFHTGNTTNNGSHSHTGSTSSDGNHSHTYYDYWAYWVASGSQNYPDGTDGYRYDASRTTNSAGTHSHSITTNTAGDHFHSFSTNYSGILENRPKNINVNYIIKY